MSLELRGITKRFGDLLANDHIDLTVEPGEIHALLGENGAGKSTLMNVLYGLYHPDAGEIVVNGTARRFRGPGDAIAAGIGMVHQHFMLVGVLTVAENVMLGRERTRLLGLLDRRRARQDVRDLSQRYGLRVDPDARVDTLPVGVQQRVEILKALARDVDVLILDEPTAVLTPQEIDELTGVMRSLRDDGRSIVFITHKLREVRAVADRITVIRRGRVVGATTPSASESELASLMVGRTVRLGVDRAPATPGAPALVVDDLVVADEQGRRVVDGVSFQVRAGEILAVAGVQGNGQTELTEALLSLRRPAAGTIRLDGRDLTGRGPREVLRAGVGYIPEDRQHDGLVTDFTVAENLVLDTADQPPHGSALTMNPTRIRAAARERVAEFDIRASSVDAPARTLSGGNQQKVVVARELSRPLRLLVAAQPTRGVDVGAMSFIHARIVAERDRGTPVVLVSSELDEVLGLADRIAVMFRGRIVGVLPGGASRDEVGLMMAGAGPAAAHALAAEHPTALTRVDQPEAGSHTGQDTASVPAAGPDDAGAGSGAAGGGDAERPSEEGRA